jgi:hypothetical protein
MAIAVPLRAVWRPLGTAYCPFRTIFLAHQEPPVPTKCRLCLPNAPDVTYALLLKLDCWPVMWKPRPGNYESSETRQCSPNPHDGYDASPNAPTDPFLPSPHITSPPLRLSSSYPPSTSGGEHPWMTSHFLADMQMLQSLWKQW